MKILRILLICLAVYVGIVVVFESLLGVVQPRPEGVLVLTTFDEDGGAHDRVLSRIDMGDQLYVAVNHWPRAWYGRVLDQPDVEVEIDGARSPRRAVVVEGEERVRVEGARPLGIVFRALTGFPPRHFVRLDPR